MKNRNTIFTTILLLLGWFAISPMGQAVLPAPDGGYPGGNTAEGQNALLSLTTGGFNTAVGFFSLRSNTTTSFNTAIGAGALLSNISDENTATGAGALFNNAAAGQNTANGAFALFSNTTGIDNTAIGFDALYSNSIGSFNIALGSFAGNNLTIGDYNIEIGNSGFANENGVIRIGDFHQIGTFIAGIRDVPTQNNDAITVLIDSAGQLGTASSSKRFKKEIKPMDRASEAILALKPVTFHYKSDKTATPQFGLIAEEVAEVNPDLVVRDADGKVYTVRYDQVNAMLLNEFLKEHRAFLKEQRKVEVQEKTIAELKSGMTALAATVKEQASQIQKVSAQLAKASPSAGGLEMSKAAPRMANNDR